MSVSRYSQHWIHTPVQGILHQLVQPHQSEVCSLSGGKSWWVETQQSVAAAVGLAGGTDPLDTAMHYSGSGWEKNHPLWMKFHPMHKQHPMIYSPDKTHKFNKTDKINQSHVDCLIHWLRSWSDIWFFEYVDFVEGDESEWKFNPLLRSIVNGSILTIWYEL